MRTNAGPRSAVLCSSTALALFTLVACGSGGAVSSVARPVLHQGAEQGVDIARPAVEQVGSALGRSTDDVHISSAYVDSLARQAAVDRAMVLSTAPALDEQQVFQSTNQRLWNLARQNPEAAGVALGLSCDYAQGKITNQDELEESFATNMASLNPTAGAYFAAKDFVETSMEAADSGDARVRLGIQLYCFAAGYRISR